MPGEVTALASSSVSVHVMWRADTAVAAFEVYRGDVKVLDVTGGRHMVDVGGLAPGTAYSFTVRARDRAGNVSAASAAVPATTLSVAEGERVPPSAPGNARGQAQGPGAAVLVWDAAADDVGVTAYDVRQGGVRVHSVAGDRTTAVVTGLRPGTDYSFTVIARDAADNSSPESNAVRVLTEQGAPDGRSTAPGGLTATPRVAEDGTYLDLSWTPPVVDGTVAAYEVYLDGRFLTTVIWGANPPTGTAQYSLPLGDAPPAAHALKIRARLPDGKWGDFSAERTVAPAGP
ncbi:fibronectin type III domain-containing protein [Embleya sp. NBC_00896]|uniref:fibronectin type III domain-containing protein n=1 Tax=Embleya sp. NBC_00896 TaxID=2975961 RepID=UPI0038646CA8|nr:fibronectin type III domain-containing protein [Embleya sp. NBC_00896]